MLSYVGVLGMLFALELLCFDFHGHANVVGGSAMLILWQTHVVIETAKGVFFDPHPSDFANQNWQICWVILPEIHSVVFQSQTSQNSQPSQFLHLVSPGRLLLFQLSPNQPVATPIPCGWGRNNLMETCKLGVKYLGFQQHPEITPSKEVWMALNYQIWGRWSTLIHQWMFFTVCSCPGGAGNLGPVLSHHQRPCGIGTHRWWWPLGSLDATWLSWPGKWAML